MSDKIWRLYNASTQRQIVDLDIEQTRQLYARMGAAEKPHWFAWQAGWLDWLRVTDVAELHVAPAQPTAPRLTPPPLPIYARGDATRVTATSATISALSDPAANAEAEAEANTQAGAEQVLASDLALEMASEASAPQPARPAPPKASFVERRKHPRYDMKLKVIIEVSGRAFRTFSKDVSLGGLQLQDRLPWDMQNDVCKVYLSSPDGRDSVEFNSRIVVDLKNPKRIQFVDPTPEYLVKLGGWMESLSKKTRKAA